MPGYAGYYTIPLEKQIILYPGHTFSVVYQLENPSGNEVTIFVDTSYTNGGWISFLRAVRQQDRACSKMSSTSGWYDLHTNTTPMCARIKAFTKTTACLHTDRIRKLPLQRQMHRRARMEASPPNVRIVISL